MAMGQLKVPKALRAKIWRAAVKWAKAKRDQREHMLVATMSRRSYAKEQRLDERRSDLEDKMYGLVAHLPIGIAEEEREQVLGTLVVMMAVGSVANMGYDKDSMFDWSAEVENNLVNVILEEVRDGRKTGPDKGED